MLESNQLHGRYEPGLRGDLQVRAVGHADRYVLGECLRRTGSGTVHLAFDSQLSREVVLKTFYADGDEAHRRAREAALLAGARAAARLNHPNIVTVHDAGLCERGVFIVTERVLGRDLRSRLADGWRPDPLQVARIAARIAQALSHAHDAGVVHGRVEPSNVFMIGRTQLKIFNFGVASAIAGLQAMPSEGTNGAPGLDSAGCMAPERLLGEAAHTRGDVYGLGLVMYEMLAGRPAFSGDSLDDIRRSVLQDDVPAVHALSPAVPVALSSIVTRAMARNPALRFRSAQHMLDELRRYLADAAGGAPRAARPLGGVRRAIAIVSVIAAGALGVVALRSVPTQTPRPVQASAPAKQASSPQTQASVPLTQASAPAAQASMPLTQASAPAAQASAPVMQASAPAAQAGAPQTQASAPAAQASAPLTQASAPAAPSPSPSPAASAASAGEPTAPVANRAASQAGGGARATVAPVATTPASSGATSAAPSPASAKRPVQRTVIKPPEAQPAPKTDRRFEFERAPVDGSNERAPSAATAPTKLATPTTPAPTSSAASSAVPLKGRGAVYFEVEPRGQVEVNGIPIGATPPMLRLTLPNGNYNITLRNEGFPPYSIGVVVNESSPVTIKHRFGP